MDDADLMEKGGEFTIESVVLVLILILALVLALSVEGTCFKNSNTLQSSSIPTVGFTMKRVTKGHVSLKWYSSIACIFPSPEAKCTDKSVPSLLVGTWAANLASAQCGNGIAVRHPP